MTSDPSPVRRFQTISYEDDIPNSLQSGTLIPYEAEPMHQPQPLWLRVTKPVASVAALMMFLSGFVGAGIFGYHQLRGTTLLAAPIEAPAVYVQQASTSKPYKAAPMNYGAQVALSQPDFFASVHDSFIKDKQSFIEADLSKMEIYYYDHGSSTFSAPILSKGKEGSWWETPAGLYKIGSKEKNHFSSFGHVYQPWSMTFQGNFFIHGWPYEPDGTPVPKGYSGGCIRLSTDDAKQLYQLISVGTPVLVYEADFKNDGFLYEPKVPTLSAHHYLLADLNNTTILAASDLNTKVPIASLTKLMTALIAVEYINLDKNVYINHVPDVPSIIPRLKAGSTVSMYSLLQLLLVESSNEAAEVIAAQVGRDKFINLMNEKAQALGLTHTHFADPSGLDDGNESSVGDLLRLAQYIYNNRSFILDLTADQNLPTVYKKGQFGTLDNFNKVKGVTSFIGGKVGETKAADQTSISFHKIKVNGEDRAVVVILLGSDNRVADIKQLLEYMASRFGATVGIAKE